MISSKKAWIVVGAALGIGFVIGWLSAVKTPVSVQSDAQRGMVAEETASIMVDFGDGTIKTYTNLSLEADDTLLTLLQKTLEVNMIAFDSKTYEGLGTLVTQIGEKKNGTGNKYWQYWVNNEKVQLGANAYKVRRGDVIEWKFLGDTGS